jgi:Holliday junction resolvasome RuvABC endonuclease subunit
MDKYCNHGWRLLAFQKFLRNRLSALDGAAKGPKMVVFEEPIRRVGGSKAIGSGEVQGQLMGVTLLELEKSGHAYRGVSVGEWKKVATGSGRSNKRQVVDWAERAYPGCYVCTVQKRAEGDDVADALGVLRFAEIETAEINWLGED